MKTLAATLLIVLLFALTSSWAFDPEPPAQTDEMLPGVYEVEWDYPDPPPEKGIIDTQSGSFGEYGGLGTPLPIQIFVDPYSNPPVKRYEVLDPDNPDVVLYYMFVKEIPGSDPLRYEVWWVDPDDNTVVMHGFATKLA